jgi:UPF0755 protein
MRRSKHLLRVVAGIVLVALATFVLLSWYLTRPITLHDDGFVYIARSTSIAAAVDTVGRHVMLPTPWLTSITARVAARLTARRIQAGWYQFHTGDTQLDVLRALFSAHRRPTVRVTIPEGLTFTEIAGLLQRTANVDSVSFHRWCESDSVCQHFGVQGGSMEGYLMPNTYELFLREDAAIVGTQLARAFAATWDREAEVLLATSGRTKHAILTLASIVQTEAAVADEMPRIAGVYVNRLERDMKLEADPTVQYALGAKRRLRYRDLDISSAYNTYVHTGLPPGPIANAGFQAIKAALEPEQHNYLFFVADGAGRHRFATNGMQHLRNVALYRAERRRQSR